VYEATKSALYEGSLFTTLAKLLLHQVAPDWLACFPSGAPRWLFDEFFLQAPVTEALFELAPSLSSDHLRVEDTEDELDGSAVVCAQARRLLEMCLIEKEGVKEMALAFGRHSQALHLAEGKQTQGWSNNRRKIGQATWLQMDKQIAQLLASVPDRAGFKAASSLQSPSFFQLIVKQLVAAIEEHQEEMRLQSMTLEEASADGLYTFSGEVIVKLCRRGHADVVASVLVPKLFQQVLHNFGNFGREVSEGEKDTPHLTWESIKHISERSYWAAVTVAIKDSHAMEKWVEALLRDMADKPIDDLQAYCILLTLFSDLLSQHIMIRMVFIEKCLFSKILPTRCLKWVLDFAVLQSPPSTVDMQNTSKKREKHLEVDVVQRLAHVWSSNKFIRSAPILKQAYLTAAVGMCVRAMDKEDMEHCDNLMKSLLEGVSCKLQQISKLDSGTP
jgi:telomere length regulation protein